MDLNSIKSIDKNNVTLTIPFSQSQVHEAISDVLVKKPMLYLLDKDHCTASTYRIDAYNGINPATISLSINKMEENTTVITGVAQNAGGGSASDIMLTEVLKDFLHCFQKALNGDYKKKKSGCVSKAAMIAVLIASTAVIFSLI